MKARLAKKQNKTELHLASVCERIANNVVDMVASALHLQRDVDEYDRFLGDVLIMLVKREPHTAIKHEVPGDAKMAVIWDEVCILLKENKELKEQLAQESNDKDKEK